MQAPDIVGVQEQATAIVQGIMAGENLDLVISGAMLLAITTLSLASIWRNRAPVMESPVAAPRTSGANRSVLQWLTPSRNRAVTAEQVAVSPRPSRKSGSQKTIRVITPVSKVPRKALTSGADALELARKSGLSRDGVAMMLAAAVPKGEMKSAVAAAVAAKSTATAMLAPGPYTQAQRVIPEKVDRPAVGTRFNARVS